MVQVHIVNRQKALPIRKRFFSSVVKETLEFLDIHCSEIGIYFVTEKEISKLHDEFFQDPTPTDCISFPLDKEYLGDIFICPSVAIAYAEKHSLPPLKETTLYLIHGVLHLIGYDDLSPKDKKKMRLMEKKCMDHLLDYFAKNSLS